MSEMSAEFSIVGIFLLWVGLLYMHCVRVCVCVCLSHQGSLRISFVVTEQIRQFEIFI